MADSLKDLRKQLEELRRDYERITRKPAALFDTGSIEKTERAIESMEGAISRAREEALRLEEGFVGINNNIETMLEGMTSVDVYSQRATRSARKLQSITEKLQSDQLGITRLSLKELKTLERKQKEERKLIDLNAKQLIIQKNITETELEQLELRDDLTDKEKDLLVAYKNGFKELKKAEAQTKARLKQEEEIEKTIGLTGAAFKGISGTLSKIGVDSQAIADIQEDMYNTAESTGSSYAVLQKAIGGIGSSLMDAISDPLVQLTFFVKTFKTLGQIGLATSDQTAEITKNLGLSTDQANDFREQMQQIAINSTETSVTQARIREANQQLNNSLGTSVVFTQQQLETQTALTQRAGLQAETAAKLLELSLETGMSQEDIYNISGQVGDGLINQKDILEGVANVSADIAANYGNNPKALAQAVFQAKRLGLTLEDTKGISNGLLDFEKSITAELEAELLTGKDLNFEKARQLALQGKSAEASAEVLRQVGGIHEFEKMNVIQKQAIADATGLSVEKLAESLKKEEALNKLAEDRNITKAEARKLQEQELAASQRMATSVENIKSAFTSLLDGPLAGIMESVTGMLNKIAQSPFLKTAVGVIGAGVGVAAAIGSIIMVGRGIMNAFKSPKGTMRNPMIVEDIGGGGGGSSDGGYYGGGEGSNRRRGKGKGRGKGRRRGSKGRRRNTSPRGRSRGRRGRGLGGALATGLSYLAPEIISSVTGGEGGGSALGDAAMMAGTDIAAEGAGSLLGRVGSSISGGFGKIGNFFSKGASAVGNFAKKINPIEALKSKIPTIGKNFGRFAKRIPVIGTLIEGLFTASDIASIVAAGGTKDDVYQDIGKRTLQGIGGIAGGIGAAAITTGLSATGIPAFILNGVAYTLGDMAGRWLFGQIADVVGARPIGEAISKTFGLESQIESANQKSPKMMATGGVVTQPVNAIVGEAGPEAVVPLNEFYRKFDELISAVKAGGDVYMDSTKVGTAMAVGTYKVQ